MLVFRKVTEKFPGPRRKYAICCVLSQDKGNGLSHGDDNLFQAVYCTLCESQRLTLMVDSNGSEINCRLRVVQRVKCLCCVVNMRGNVLDKFPILIQVLAFTFLGAWMPCLEQNDRLI